MQAFFDQISCFTNERNSARGILVRKIVKVLPTFSSLLFSARTLSEILTPYPMAAEL